VAIPKNSFKDSRGLKKIPTMTQVVAVALIDAQQRVLMQRRAADRQHGGLWEFPGGKVETGESRAQALVREIREELALDLQANRIELLAKAEDPDIGIVILLYTCREWSGDPACLDADALGWFTANELAGLAMPPLDVPLAKAVKQVLEMAK
jgi:8-oxo-dGTP diphosphatase